MASRVNESALRGRAGHAPGRAAGAVPRPGLTIGQRWLFVFALLTFGIACTYSASATLTRVWPALFPGHQLSDVRIPGVSGVIDKVAPALPDVVKPNQPGPGSVFQKRRNILVIGVDKRPGARDEDAYNTDTIMIATIDPLSKRAAMLSFPRDMFIDIHPAEGGVYKDRINASYAAGFIRGKSFDAGAQQLAKDIKMDFGIEVTDWVWLDFKGVEKLVNEIGGVDLDIPENLSVPRWYYSDDDENAKYVSFPPGEQHLDGYNAVAFGRYRNDSDIYRVHRQQLVVEAAITKVFERSLLDNLFGLYALYDAYSSTVHTSVGKGDIPGLALLLKETNGRMESFSLGDPVNGRDTVFGHMTDAGASVLLWDPQNVQTIINQAFTGGQYSNSVVEIQNGTGDPQAAMAGSLGRYLKIRKGLPTVELGLDVAVQGGTTILLYSDDWRPMAQDIAKWLGLPESAIKSQPRAGEGFPDVAIVVGRDFKVPGN